MSFILFIRNSFIPQEHIVCYTKFELYLMQELVCSVPIRLMSALFVKISSIRFLANYIQKYLQNGRNLYGWN